MWVGGGGVAGQSGGKKHNRSSVGKERYTMLCVGYKGSKRNGNRPLRSPCLGTWNARGIN